MLTELIAPQASDLTTLDRLKTQLGISGTGSDSVYSSLIPASSARIVKLIRGGPRRYLEEDFAGSGFYDKALHDSPAQFSDSTVRNRTPIGISGSAEDIANDYAVNANAAVVRRFNTWYRTIRPDWKVGYWGGWLVPGDDFTSAAITFASGTPGTATLSAGRWPYVVNGDDITFAGTASNDGTFVVSNRVSDTVLELDNNVTDEAEGQTITVTVSNLPLDIERACILDSRDGYGTRSSGTLTGLTEEVAGEIKERREWGDTFQSKGVSAEVMALLGPWLPGL